MTPGTGEVVVTGTFASWQQAARDLVRRGVEPDDVRWVEDRNAHHVFGPEAGNDPRLVVPRRFVELAQAAATHQNAGRWAIMYRVLWRLVHENRRLLDSLNDPDVRALEALQPSKPGIPFELSPPASADDARTMPALGPVIPLAASLSELAAAAAACTACELYRRATQVVFGRGPAGARLALVGEQPGDQEDLQGAPFVGPAGEVLDRALAEIGLDRHSVYISNVVKHFKWEPRGKRRIHQTPRANEVQACRPWLEAELAAVRPRVIVCLGATAAQALIGTRFRITRSRGEFFRSSWAPWVMGTYHPSAVLRADDPSGAEALYTWLVEDLRRAASRAAEAQTLPT